MSGISLLVEERQRDGSLPICRLHTVGHRFPLRIPPGPIRAVPYQDLTILVVEWDDVESIEAISRDLGRYGFPNQMVHDVGTDGVIEMPQPTFPEFRASWKSDCWSVLRFRGLDGRVSKYVDGSAMVEEKEIEKDSKSETAVGTWICHNASLGPELDAQPLILLLCRSTEGSERHHVRDFAARLRDYLTWYPERVLQMEKNPLFIYVVLYQMYNSFYTLSHQFERVYRDVAANHEKSLYGIFGRCYQLNKGLISMSYCYPDVLTHKAAIKRLAALNRGEFENRPIEALHAAILVGHDLDLDRLLKDMEMDLQDFEAHLGFVSDRFKSALDLEFNLSGERLNLIMMWFTGFTVLFTPITFVAAVFALTETDMVWFLLAGSITLIISIIICIWAYSSVVNLGKRVKSSQFRGLLHKLPYQEPGRRPKPSDDPDDDPRPPKKPSHSSAHPRPMMSAYTRHDSDLPPWPPAAQFYNAGSSSSSSSNGDPRYHRRSSFVKPTVAAPRRRTESGTMMYSRLRPPQSSSMQRPHITTTTSPRLGTRPKTTTHPPPRRRSRQYVKNSKDYIEIHTRTTPYHVGPKPPAGPPIPPPGPTAGPSGTTRTGSLPPGPRSISPSASFSASSPPPSPTPPAPGPTGPRNPHEY